MVRSIFLLILICKVSLFSINFSNKKIILASKKIFLKEFPHAYNPSILKFEDRYILTFRHCPDISKPWFSEIGIVILNQQFEPISTPQILQTRFKGHKAPPQAEDARILAHQGKLFLLYNDNVDKFVYPNVKRHMYLAELTYRDNQFDLSVPKKLSYVKPKLWEKNWVPFLYENELFFIYSIFPHQILKPNLTTGECPTAYKHDFSNHWKWGKLRGGTPAQLVDGNYLAFFHSSNKGMEDRSSSKCQYYLGAYLFSAKPPFQILKMSPKPIQDARLFLSDRSRRIFFPSGFLISGDNIYLVYGKDDREMGVAKIGKKALMKSLIDIKK